MNDILIYQASEIADVEFHAEEFSFEIWRPSINRMVPPGKGKKYILFTLFHFFSIFRNKNYMAVLVYTKSRLVASLLVVPTFFKWPFMNKDDVQFTYVMTDKEFRGKNFANRMIRFAAGQCVGVKNYWYVTTTENIASVRVAEKTGFTFFSKGKRVGLLKKLSLSD